MANLFENLNDRQQEAVLETEGYVRVIAGAGSGKTKLLVSRYAYLVQDYGIDSSNILCVTFTNKAAGEMKKRIRGLIGDDNAVSLICTYHGFCNRLLRENPEKLFLNKQFQILDTHQQKAVLSEIYQKFELKLDYASFEAILRKIGRVKKDTEYVPRMCNPQPCPILNEIKNQDDRIIEEFLQRQKATYSLDFHDLISFAIYLLETEADVREKWQDRLNYIMVDEFQDSSSVEMRLVEILSGKYRNLMIVGDPDQNIYEWRGSDVRLLVDFDKNHEGTRTIILNQNYRSTPQILKCANTLIEKNELRLKKDLFTKNSPGEPVVHYHSKDDFEEMDRVAAEICRLHKEESLRYSDFAVIYRSGFLSRVAEKKLVEKNIPYEIFGGVRFYQRMEILDILAYLKLIAYDDDSAFRRVVNTPRRRFGRAKMNFLEELRERGQGRREDGGDWQEAEPAGIFREDGGMSRSGHATLFGTLSDHLEEREFQNSDVSGFVHFVEDMRGECAKLHISDIVNKVTEKTGYESYIRELGDEERLDNLAEFKRIANEFEREFGENLSLGDFLQQIALQSGEEDGDESRDTVKLMTIHASKGLEFPAVFILGFTEGIFPSAKTLGERKKLGLEEERRLCYVAITRAEKYLFLMESEGASPNGAKKLVSRFLEEIGEENYRRVGRISEELKRESKGYAAKLNGEMAAEPVRSLNPGDTVEHHVFGKGVIQSVDVKRGSYCIRFEKLQHPRNIAGSYFAKKRDGLTERNPAAVTKAEETLLSKKISPKAQTKAQSAVDRGDTLEVGENRTQETFLSKELFPKVQTKTQSAVDRGDTLEMGENRIQETFLSEALSPKAQTKAQSAVDRGDTLETWGSRVQGSFFQEDVIEEESVDLEWQEIASEAQERETEEESDYDLPALINARLWSSESYEEEEERTDILPPTLMRQAETEETPWDGDSAETEEISWDGDLAETEETFKDGDSAETEEIPGDEGSAEVDKSRKEGSPNLWKREDVPHSGWSCTGVEDLGAPLGVCQMCGYQIIRYVHHMEHPGYGSLAVGCICAGKMEGDIPGAKRREAEFKNRQTRQANFFRRTWKVSRKGNEYLKIDGHVVVIYHFAHGRGFWKYSVDSEFSGGTYSTRQQALAGVFDELERRRGR